MSSDKQDYGDPETRQRILAVSLDLLAERGSRMRLVDVAEQAGVSRQALYLHFGDRTGLLLALVKHMDETLELDRRLAHVHAAPDATELLMRAMRLNTRFWTLVLPVAQVLEAAQYTDEALGAAWRNRMAYRRKTFAAMIEQLAEQGDLSPDLSIDDASALLYGVAHFDTWRELTRRVGWSEDQYVAAMTRLLCRSLLDGV
jgi:AcrR family transcriptional regulator